MAIVTTFSHKHAMCFDCILHSYPLTHSCSSLFCQPFFNLNSAYEQATVSAFLHLVYFIKYDFDFYPFKFIRYFRDLKCRLHMWVCVYACTYVCVRVCACTRAHAHTHGQPSLISSFFIRKQMATFCSGYIPHCLSWRYLCVGHADMVIK